MNTVLEEYNQHEEKRPTLLMVLAILSFIYITYTLIGSVSAYIQGPMDEATLTSTKVEITKSINELKELGGGNTVESFLRGSIELIEATKNNFNLQFLSNLIICIIGLVGVYLMFNRKKIGFHIYIIYSILASIQIYLLVNPSFFSNTIVFFNLFISGIFVLLYSKNLKWLK